MNCPPQRLVAAHVDRVEVAAQLRASLLINP